jgi:PilZ domain-containing protein
MTPSDNRVSPRVNKLYFIAYVNLEGDEQKSPVSLGRTLNISATGVGMEVYQPVAVGSLMEMEIGLSRENIPVQGTVVHANDLENGRFYLGIQFDRVQPKLAAVSEPE